jgi:ribonuclease P protein component
MKTYTLARSERVKSKKNHPRAFQRKPFLFFYPLLIYYRQVADAPKPKALFSASKKRFPKAVLRNRVKRLLRESYRLEKSRLLSLPANLSVGHIALVYVGKELPNSHQLQNKMGRAFRKLADLLAEGQKKGDQPKS